MPGPGATDTWADAERRVRDLLAANSRAEASLRAMLESLEASGTELTGLRTANEQVTQKLERTRELLCDSEAERLRLSEQLEAVGVERDATREALLAAQEDRLRLLEDHDRFIATLLTEADEQVARVRGEVEREVQSLQRELAAVRAEAARTAEQLSSASAESQQHHQEVLRLRATQQEAKARHQTSLATLQQDLAAARQVVTKLQARIAQLDRAHRRHCDGLCAQYQDQLAQERALREEQRSAMEQNLESQRSEHHGHLESLTREHSTALQHQKTERQQEVAAVEERYDQQIAELETYHAELHRQREAALAQLQQAHAAERATLEAELRREHETTLARLQQAHAAELETSHAELHRQHEAALAQLQQAHAAERATLEAERDAARERGDRLAHAADAGRAARERLVATVPSLRMFPPEAVQQLERELADARAELNRLTQERDGGRSAPLHRRVEENETPSPALRRGPRTTSPTGNKGDDPEPLSDLAVALAATAPSRQELGTSAEPGEAPERPRRPPKEQPRLRYSVQDVEPEPTHRPLRRRGP